MSQVEHHTNGREYWQSLQQLVESPDARERAADEFDGYDPDEIRSLSRRRFMQFMGGSMALAGLTLTGCRRYPEQRLAPFTSNPDGRMPGVSARYATAVEIGGIATGLLVSSYDGRPIKIEGHPDHPYSLGATDAITQATVLDMYDPERSRAPMDRRSGEARVSDWTRFQAFARDHFTPLKAAQGAGLAVLAEAGSGVTMAMMREQLAAEYPAMQWFEYEPVSRDQAIEGTRLAFGEALRPLYHLAEARVIASFDCDLLTGHPAKLKHARDWAKGRRSADEGRMNRLYQVESVYSPTGTSADHRFPRPPHKIEAMLITLASRLGLANLPSLHESLTDADTAAVTRMAEDLRQAGSHALVVAGDRLSPAAQAVAHRINAHLGSQGTTVTFVTEPDGDRPSHREAVAQLVAAIDAGEIQTLVILGGNPVYNAPADVDFTAALTKVPTSIHLAEYQNETSAQATWHLPRAHYLETWGDARAWDGTLSIAQPLIYPLYDGKSPAELLAILAGSRETDGYALTRRAMRNLLPATNLERHWRRALHDGVVPDSAFAVVQPEALDAAAREELTPPPAGGYAVVFQPSPVMHDGRFANNAWLQETPDHLTKVTWDNPVVMSKSDADREGLTYDDVVTLTVAGRTLDLAVYILPGHPVGVLGLTLGYGRRECGTVGKDVGFNTYAIRASDSSHVARASLAKTGRTYPLASTQEHHAIDALAAWGTEKRVGERRQSGTIIREATLDAYIKDPLIARRNEHGDMSLQLFEPPLQSQWDAKANQLRAEGHPNPPTAFNDPHAWGMAIDLSSCIGCNACVVACQAENNIPVVGKQEVARSREMHWIRIDRYFKGSPDDESPDVVSQPMMCVHCENAPCEQVCPVAATVHDTEGLNTMVYNRCIGTRYCSNNCPYKVRRFNYLDWHSTHPRGQAQSWLEMPDTQQNKSIDDIKKMLFNPDVTVRMRGVMEKCTYCTQRINAVKIDKRNDGETIRDGDVVTACQQVCPTEAIIFGDLNDHTSRVSKLHRENKRTYSVLGELNVRPRTQYLARITNPTTKDGA